MGPTYLPPIPVSFLHSFVLRFLHFVPFRSNLGSENLPVPSDRAHTENEPRSDECFASILRMKLRGFVRIRTIHNVHDERQQPGPESPATLREATDE